jgi:hypothetical protein
VFYSSVDYLLWKVRSGSLPATATSVPVGLISVDISDLFTTNPALPGTTSGQQVVGFAPVSITNTATFGAGPRTETGSQNGARFTLGWWVDPEMTFGVESSVFILEPGSDAFAAISANSGNQFLVDSGFTRNLFLVQGGVQTPLATFPIFVPREARSSLVGTFSNTFYGGELNARCVGLRFGALDFGGLVGFRYLNYKEDLAIANQLQLFRPAGLAPTLADETFSLSDNLTFATNDRIRVRNQFYGAQVGADLDAKFGAFFVYTRVKLAVGTMHQTADVLSTTRVVNNDTRGFVISPPGLLTPGGLLASPADVGRRTRDAFGFVPELNLKVGYQVTSWLRAYAGYDALVMTNAARAGTSSVVNTLNTQVQVANSGTTINVNQPTFRFREQDVWVQGVSFGLEARY